MAIPGKGRADHLDLGDWNAVCSLCNRKRKASQMVKNWQGYWRCPEHNENRQPQDFVRGEADIQTVPWSQPPTEIYVEICSYDGISAVPGLALPGCMIPGRATWSGGTAIPPPIVIPPMTPPIAAPTDVVAS